MSKAIEGQLQTLVRLPLKIISMKWEPCPNPECDPEEGCCLCEHTGKILSRVLDELQANTELQPNYVIGNP